MSRSQPSSAWRPVSTDLSPPSLRPYTFLPPFALYAAFPRSDYYDGSAPKTADRWSPQSARHRAGQTVLGSRVPVSDLGPVGVLLYPW